MTCKLLTWPRGTAAPLVWNYKGDISLSTFWLTVYILYSNISNYVLRGFYFACVSLFSSSEPLTWWTFGFSQVFWHAHEYFGDCKSSPCVADRGNSHQPMCTNMQVVIFVLSKSHSLLLPIYRPETLKSASKKNLKCLNCVPLPSVIHGTWTFWGNCPNLLPSFHSLCIILTWLTKNSETLFLR